ncbi:MAG: hypothetical protein HUK20_04660 [Fibrobacter sp.]|nr:hypothetical protein [Fibrobacter sp.]
MSFWLSLTSVLMSGHFTFGQWMLSFVLSSLTSFVIGFAFPVRKWSGQLCSKWNISTKSFKGLMVITTLSDLIYTPIITTIMVVTMLTHAAKYAPPGAVPPIPQVLVPSLFFSLAIGFVIIAIAHPLILKFLQKKFKQD